MLLAGETRGLLGFFHEVKRSVEGTRNNKNRANGIVGGPTGTSFSGKYSDDKKVTYVML